MPENRNLHNHGKIWIREEWLCNIADRRSAEFIVGYIEASKTRNIIFL